METPEQLAEKAKAEIDAFSIELWNAHESQPPAHFFHYTSTEGLVGIVSSRKFFLSDLLASNDKSEIRYGIDLAMDVLQETREHLLSKALLESFQREDRLVGLGDRYFLHAICFCTSKDSLTQWRGYSSTGGFAIGMDFQKLLARARRAEFAISRMLYERDQQIEIIRRTVAHASNLFDRLVTIWKDKQDADSFLLETGTSMLKSIFRFKNEAFKSEDEWRLFTLDPVEEMADKVKFRSRGNAIIPYKELAFEPDLISHIYRSPGMFPASADYAVKRLAQSLGEHVIVGVSQVPL
jgi:hypothetical protein